MKARRIFETIIYADDLEESKRFYGTVFGLPLISSSEICLAFRLEGSVLLVFDRKRSCEAGRAVPAHGTEGAGHVAFAMQESEFGDWNRHLTSHEVEIEKFVEWDDGGTSIYVRDPSGNSVELAPPTLWGGGWDFS